MESVVHNSLADATSVYLRSAMHQPVQWLSWGTEAFARAEAEDKPVLLDIGAVWCHWCHVMDRESYEIAEVAALINEHFVAIKVDRDERPDLDARYQAAVNAISGQGGWPLTVFLTPEGKPYFGGTYFPAAERYGQPGFERVLRTMAGSFYQQREEVEESASSVMEAIEYGESYDGPPVSLAEPSAAMHLFNKLVDTTLQQFDVQHGGFGSQPKFPHAAALDLLIEASGRGGVKAEQARNAALTTLHAMARGGIFDQLEGGFHRYSVDARWVVPHFEKMLYDNAVLLSTYVRAAQQFGDAECRDTATVLLDWMISTLLDSKHGGFFSLQTATSLPDSKDTYYTWTRDEAAAVLTEDELRLAEAYFDLGPIGDMPSDPARNVIFRPVALDQAAQQAGVDVGSAHALLGQAKRKLQSARKQRLAPPVSRAMYTAWNGMAISAFVKTAQVLNRPDALLHAQRSLDRALSAVVTDGAVAHVIACEDAQAQAPQVPGMLDDHVLLAHACLDMWEANGDASYLRTAERIAEVLLLRFRDAERGGFFDVPTDEPKMLGALAARRKPVQDAFTPAGNSCAAALLLRLYTATADERFNQAARKTLECLAGVVEHLGLYAATFGLALVRLTSAR